MNLDEKLDAIFISHRDSVQRFTDLDDASYALIFKSSELAAQFVKDLAELREEVEIDVFNPIGSPYVRIRFGNTAIRALAALTNSLLG